MHKFLSKEDRLIRSCLLAANNESCLSELNASLVNNLNWQGISEQSRLNAVGPLVFSVLSQSALARSLVPADIWNEFERNYYAVASRNSLICEKLNTILDSLYAKGLEVILLKGVALINTVYRNIAWRPIYDIDILIKNGDQEKVKKILNTLGYLNSSTYPEAFYAQDDTMVDVHCAVINETRIKSRGSAHRINMDKVWAESLPLEFHPAARKLSVPHNLMQLCLHFALHHGLSGLIWLFDIALVIQSNKDCLDWERFIKECLDYRITKPVYYALFLVQQNLRQVVPDYVLENLRPKKQSILHRTILRSALSKNCLQDLRFILAIDSMENISDKLRFAKEILLPSRKVLATRYDHGLNRFILHSYILHLNSVLQATLQIFKKTCFSR